MALNTYALTTVARLKAYLNITVATYDTVLERIIDSVSDFVERYCDRRFLETTYTQEIYDGSGIDKLPLKQYPVNSRNTVKFEYRDGTDNSTSWTEIDSTDYFVKYTAGLIQMPAGVCLNNYPQNYRVTYTAGYAFKNDAAPLVTLEYVGIGDLEYAVWKLCGKFFYNKKSTGPVANESIGTYSIGYGGFTTDVISDPELKGILDKYVRISFM